MAGFLPIYSIPLVPAAVVGGAIGFWRWLTK